MSVVTYLKSRVFWISTLEWEINHSSWVKWIVIRLKHRFWNHHMNRMGNMGPSLARCDCPQRRLACFCLMLGSWSGHRPGTSSEPCQTGSPAAECTA